MSAPGPQQSDEVRPVWPDDREWVPDDEVTCMYCQRYKNRKVCRCGDPNPPVRPAAPSAQPDRRVARYDAQTGEVDYGDWSITPAQPVRDTEEGRR